MWTTIEAGAGTLLLMVVICNGCFAQVVDTTTWGFGGGGRVLAIARAENTIYLGGSFSYVGPSTGGGVPCDVHSGMPGPDYPRVVGRVNCVLPDGSGGWFIGGQFTFVGREVRSNLAHILAGGVVSSWNPSPNEKVWAMTLVDGVLYVGGDFSAVAGVPRAHLAALSPASEVPLSWKCDTDNRVAAIVVRGSSLYIGGWFTSVGGESRAHVAAIDRATGAPLPWRVNLDDQVKALALGDTTLYIGGYFTSANGQFHECVVAVGLSTGAIYSWDPTLERSPASTIDGGPHVSALLVYDGTLFVAGSFSRLGGQPRFGLAQIDLGTGQATGWSVAATYPRSLGAEFWCLVRSGDTLFVAGEFDSLGGASGANVAALSTTSGERLAWDPRTNDYVFAVAIQGRTLYLGGWFTSVGTWVERHGLAAIDADTGRVTGWDPNPNAYVTSVLTYGGKVYVGGYFSEVGGQPREHIASLDPVTGGATAWNPGADWAVWTMAPMGDAIAVGGEFTWIGGVPEMGLAAIDTLTALATTWNPEVGGNVSSIAMTDSVAYVGVTFEA